MKQLDEIKAKLNSIDEKLDEVRINTAVLNSRVSKLEKDAEANKKLTWGAITSAVIAIITTLFKYLFTNSSNGGL